MNTRSGFVAVLLVCLLVSYFMETPEAGIAGK